ncbi:hypothetical protein DPMN_081426 [Dreissena polymorpha]|uniref:Uncharacterized protein n=1 Tax=Dreissena polymorpha TaxID=45954 RepID=A0A9D3Y6B5_DREPO|nr:hypothetical protein DPMN_081426 [Dreissena polymorpha]
MTKDSASGCPSDLAMASKHRALMTSVNNTSSSCCCGLLLNPSASRFNTPSVYTALKL